MKSLIPILFLFIISACQKEEFNPAQTKSFSVHSNYTGADYLIKIALPDNYDPSSKKYTSLYVLDGEENFSFVADKCHDLSVKYSTENLLVIGIGYGNDRSFDYTPSKANEGGGGAENFMHFIKEELIPRIESEFGADTLRSNRIILGHSFGGLLTSYAFTNFNEVFGNYFMLSPSIWYDNEIMLRHEQEHRALNKDNAQMVFMGLGSLESDGRMMAPFEAFYQRLHNNYPEIKLRKNIETQQSHSGSKNPNIEKALNFYFQNR